MGRCVCAGPRLILWALLIKGSQQKAQHALLALGRAQWFSVLGACYLGISLPQTRLLLTIRLNIPQKVCRT